MKSLQKIFEKETGKRALVAVVGHGEKAYASWDYQVWLEKRVRELEQQSKSGQVDVVVIELPPLKEMEEEILEALENLDIIVHTDEPMIGNRFATAYAIYKVFKNKLDQ